MPTASTTTVLLADDSAVARLAVARRLKAAGLTVLELDSAEATRTIEPGAFTCALLDLDLGDGDGVDVALALRTLIPELPIAFFSGGACPALELRARAIGPLFVKPDDLDDAVAWALLHAS